MNREDGKDDRKVKTADVYSKDSGDARKYPDYRAAVYPDQYVISDDQVPGFKPGKYSALDNNCQTFTYLFKACLLPDRQPRGGMYGERKHSWLGKFRDHLCDVICCPMEWCILCFRDSIPTD